MSFIIGASFSQWMKLLWENKFRIDPKYFPRAAFLTLLSARNSFLRKKEERLYRTEVEKTQIFDPVFILGHWRSGTTLVHSLMSLDDRFAYPNLFQVSHPHCFLTKEKLVEKVLSRIPPQKRPMDNMEVTFISPGEDESAIAALSTRSPIIGMGFPNNRKLYNMFHTFEGKEDDLKIWEESFIWYLKKLSWRYKRPLVLKSPIHTGRVKILLKHFPGAKFIHIYRNPFVVFQSTLNLYRKLIPEMTLQLTDISEWEEDIINNYITMYDAYFAEKTMIPPERLIEIRFEDFEKDAEGFMKTIYEKLDLGDIDPVLQKIRKYLDGQKEYKKNKYTQMSDAMAGKISKTWKRSFDEWGYSKDYSSCSDVRQKQIS